MRRAKSNLAGKAAKDPGSFTRPDKIALISEIQHMMEHLDYVSVAVFKEATSHVTAAFLRGRRIPTTDPAYDEIAPQLIRFARISKSSEGRWFNEWVKRVQNARPERVASREGILTQIVKHILPRITVELGDFGYASASEMGQEIQVTDLTGCFHVFEDEDQLRAFGLQVMEAASEIERSRSIVEPTGVEAGYEAIVVADWENAIIADAWLNRRDNQDLDD